MGPLRQEQEQQQQHEVLLLDTTVDSTVDFTALSVVPRVTRRPGRTATRIDSSSTSSSSTLPAVPVAGSKGWLPSMVDVGRKEALLREMASEGTHHNAFGGDGGGGGGGVHNACEAFFAVDVECVLHKYRRWHECFPRVKPFYAVKCNPNSAVVRALAMNPGCGFDVASAAEMDQVIGCDVDPSRMIYANPCKDSAALDHALSAGIVTMTFDSKNELHKIRRRLDARAKVRGSGGGKAQKVQMVLRLRVPDDHSNCPLGEKYGAIEQDCRGLITLAIDLRLPLVGVSFHCGSGCEDAQAYPSALLMARAVFDLAAQQGLRLTLLDIGGGFPGWDGSESVYHPPSREAAVAADVGNGSPGNGSPMREVEGGDGSGSADGGGSDGDIAVAAAAAAAPLSLAQVAKVTVPVLDRLFPPSSGVKVIAEPGRYLVEASHILFARIYAKRRLTLRGSEGPNSTIDAGGVSGDGQRRTTAYFIGEGVHGCFKDRVLCDVNYEPCPVSPKQPLQEEPSPSLSLLDIEAMGADGLGERQLPTAVEEEAEEDAMVMGPSGLPTDVVARKRLPRWLAPGDWLYFSRMGAYTASIATVSSSAALHASYCYVAGTPAAAVGGCVGVGSVDRQTQ